MDVIKLDDLLNKRPAKEPESVSEILNALLQSRDEIDSLSASIAYNERQIQDAQKRIRGIRGVLVRERRNFSKFAALFTQKFNESQIPAQYTGARFFYNGEEISDVLEYSADPDDENAPQMITGMLGNSEVITVAANDENLKILETKE